MLKYIDIHTHHETNHQIISVYNIMVGKTKVKLNPSSYYSAGIHPWYINENNIDQQISELKNLLLWPNVIALGETGIDRQKNTGNLQLQEKLFVQHVELSETLQKPFIIHCVKSYDKIIYWHKKLLPTQAWILHGIIPNENIIASLIRHGIKISLGKLIYKTDISQLLFLQKISENHFFIESDEECYPFLLHLYEKVSKIKNISVIDLQIQQINNFAQTFNIQLP